MWERTGPASRRWSKSCPARSRRPRAKSSSTARRSRSPAPPFARRYGIAMVYQETSLVPTLTVAQNLYLGDEKFFNRLRGTYIEAQQFLQSLNFPVDPTATVQSLGTAKRQMVEIARAVRLNAKIIIFDEPTATLTPEEKHHLFALDRAAAQGTGFDHLHQPRVGGSARNLRSDHHSQGRRPHRHGRRRDFLARDDHPPHGRPVADRRTLWSRGRRARGCARPVRKSSACKTCRCRTWCGTRRSRFSRGRSRASSGLSARAARRRPRSSPASSSATSFMAATFVSTEDPCATGRRAQAVGDGVVYVTEDRKGDGFFETMSVAENIYIGQISSRESHGAVASMSEMQGARRRVDEEAQHQDAEQRRSGHRTFRRQSAEGGHCEGAGPETQADHFR